MHFKHYENPYSGLAQYVNCAAANPGADAGMYDASEQYKLSTVVIFSANPVEPVKSRTVGLVHVRKYVDRPFLFVRPLIS